MLFDDTYLTIASATEANFRDRGSKFLGYAFPVQSEEEIKQHLQDLKKQYPDATHHCYAWKLGASGIAYRANDDGEPAGSAGKPILGQLQSRRLTNTLVVVVRYFGGSLLGVPGLINAYKTAAGSALEKAEIINKTVNDIYKVNFPYILMNDIMKIIRDEGLKIISQHSDNECEVTFSVRKSHLDKVLNRFGSAGTKPRYISTC